MAWAQPRPLVWFLPELARPFEVRNPEKAAQSWLCRPRTAVGRVGQAVAAERRDWRVAAGPSWGGAGSGQGPLGLAKVDPNRTGSAFVTRTTPKAKSRRLSGAFK